MEKLLKPDEVAPLADADAAPHLRESRGAGSHVAEWRVLEPNEPLPDAFASSDESSWPPRWHTLCWILAQGMTQRDAAREAGYTESRVSLILGNPKVREKIERIKAEHYGDAIQKNVARIAPKALNVFEEIIDGTDQTATTGNRLAAAQWVLEKHSGKPKQEIVGDSGLGAAAVITALEALRAATQSREAGSPGSGRPSSSDEIDITPEPAKDPIDLWVTANVPVLRGEKT